MEESHTLHGREEYRLYSFYLHRSHHRPIKLNVVRDDYTHTHLFFIGVSLHLISAIYFLLRWEGCSTSGAHVGIVRQGENVCGREIQIIYKTLTHKNLEAGGDMKVTPFCHACTTHLALVNLSNLLSS